MASILGSPASSGQFPTCNLSTVWGALQILIKRQLAGALTLIELDGVVRRLTLCPPDLPHEYLPSVIGNAGIDAIVCDHDSTEYGNLGIRLHFTCTKATGPAIESRLSRYLTEWVLLTSGTSGLPRWLYIVWGA